MNQIYKSAAGERAVKERYAQFLAHWPVVNRQFHVPTREGDRPRYDSDAYALWLDDVLGGLGVERASFAGISLGGWLALDYAIRRSARVASLVLLCPGGVGRETTSPLKLLFVILPLLLLGRWGRRKAAAKMLGAAEVDSSPAAKIVGEFMSLIFRHFRQNLAKVSRFSDEALAGLRCPLLLIVGARDAMLDAAETRRRLESVGTHVEVRWLPETGHAVVGQTAAIEEFLLRSVRTAADGQAFATHPPVRYG